MWSNSPEFTSLSVNKDYKLEIIKNASETQNSFFFPRPLQEGTPGVTLEKDGDDLKASFKLLSANLPADFISGFGLTGTNKALFTSFFDVGSLVKEEGEPVFTAQNAFQNKTLTAGDKFLFNLNLDEFNPFDSGFYEDDGHLL